jgi:DNA-binding transcriptional MerR regulator
MKYTAYNLAKLAGITVKTLYHYDKIGLLKPIDRSEAGYRYYGKAELLRLQQILFLKELDFPLERIKMILSDPNFDTLDALNDQKKLLFDKLTRLQKLLNTIDKTINDLKNNKGGNIMLSDEELYDGFETGKAMEYRKEAKDRWGADSVTESENRLKKLGRKGFELVKQQGIEITQNLASFMDKHPGHPDVQDCIAQYHKYLGNFYEVSKERLLGLGNLYVDDPRFTAYYDKFKPGLAVFVKKAIEYYVNEGNGVKI